MEYTVTSWLRIAGPSLRISQRR